MSDALIGYTGFVGSTLSRAIRFEGLFNSKSIHEIDGRHFDTIVCAGARATKWLANKEPDSDRTAILDLIGHLKTVHAKRFVLVSTVDVYHTPVRVAEGDIPQVVGLHPYGAHRLMLERFVAEFFDRTTIVRLPGLFGTGLRKNVIFDFLHRNQPEKINPAGVLQWYPMRRFACDLARILSVNLSVLNVAVEPIRTSLIRDRFFPNIAIGDPGSLAPHYDTWTDFPEVLGGQGRYHLSADEALEELGHFVAAERQGD